MVEEDDGDEAPRNELLAPTVFSGRLRVARSLADAGPGEIVMVGRRGQALGPREVIRLKVASWGMMAASGVTLGVVYGALFSPLTGVIAGVAIELFALFRLRHWPAFRAAMAQAAASQWEQGHAALLALERRRLPAGQRQNVQVVLAALESILGQPEKALDRLEAARGGLSWNGYGARFLRCQAASVRAGALATLGRFDEARRAHDELAREADAAAGRSGRARGDYLDMLVQMTALKIAAESDDPTALPNDDTLHGWSRAALGRSRFGEMLVSLAWAFERRGDEEMARHLLAEAPSRIPRWSLATTSPRLDAWTQERLRAWGIEPREG